MIDVKSLRLSLIRPLLKEIKLWNKSAENLIVGTGLVESNLSYLVQNCGPALGLWQIEPPTYQWIKYKIACDKTLQTRILAALNYSELPDEVNLIYNLGLSIIICRIKYLLSPQPLPDSNDVKKLSLYWGEIYNTRSDPLQMNRFCELYHKHGEHNLY